MKCIAQFPTHPPTDSADTSLCAELGPARNWAIQPVQNAPSRPPPFSPLLLCLFSLVARPLQPVRPANHRTALATLTSPRWFNLISPHSIRPLALWVTGLFGDTLEKPNQCLVSLISFDVVAVPQRSALSVQSDTATVYDWIEFWTVAKLQCTTKQSTAWRPITLDLFRYPIPIGRFLSVIV